MRGDAGGPPELRWAGGSPRYECQKCSIACAEASQRYRLCVKVAEDRTLHIITAFGSCLERIFGGSANSLHRHLQESGDLPGDVDGGRAQELLFQAAEDVLIGRSFLFAVKVPDGPPSGGLSHLVACQIIPINDDPTDTILSRFHGLTEALLSNGSSQPSTDLSTDATHGGWLDLAATESSGSLHESGSQFADYWQQSLGLTSSPTLDTSAESTSCKPCQSQPKEAKKRSHEEESKLTESEDFSQKKLKPEDVVVLATNQENSPPTVNIPPVAAGSPTDKSHTSQSPVCRLQHSYLQDFHHSGNRESQDCLARVPSQNIQAAESHQVESGTWDEFPFSESLGEFIARLEDGERGRFNLIFKDTTLCSSGKKGAAHKRHSKTTADFIKTPASLLTLARSNKIEKNKTLTETATQHGLGDGEDNEPSTFVSKEPCEIIQTENSSKGSEQPGAGSSMGSLQGCLQKSFLGDFMSQDPFARIVSIQSLSASSETERCLLDNEHTTYLLTEDEGNVNVCPVSYRCTKNIARYSLLLDQGSSSNLRELVCVDNEFSLQDEDLLKGYISYLQESGCVDNEVTLQDIPKSSTSRLQALGCVDHELSLKDEDLPQGSSSHLQELGFVDNECTLKDEDFPQGSSSHLQELGYVDNEHTLRDEDLPQGSSSHIQKLKRVDCKLTLQDEEFPQGSFSPIQESLYVSHEHTLQDEDLPKGRSSHIQELGYVDNELSLKDEDLLQGSASHLQALGCVDNELTLQDEDLPQGSFSHLQELGFVDHECTLKDEDFPQGKSSQLGESRHADNELTLQDEDFPQGSFFHIQELRHADCKITLQNKDLPQGCFSQLKESRHADYELTLQDEDFPQGSSVHIQESRHVDFKHTLQNKDLPQGRSSQLGESRHVHYELTLQDEDFPQGSFSHIQELRHVDCKITLQNKDLPQGYFSQLEESRHVGYELALQDEDFPQGSSSHIQELRRVDCKLTLQNKDLPQGSSYSQEKGCVDNEPTLQDEVFPQGSSSQLQELRCVGNNTLPDEDLPQLRHNWKFLNTNFEDYDASADLFEAEDCAEGISQEMLQSKFIRSSKRTFAKVIRGIKTVSTSDLSSSDALIQRRNSHSFPAKYWQGSETVNKKIHGFVPYLQSTPMLRRLSESINADAFIFSEIKVPVFSANSRSRKSLTDLLLKKMRQPLAGNTSSDMFCTTSDSFHLYSPTSNLFLTAETSRRQAFRRRKTLVLRSIRKKIILEDKENCEAQPCSSRTVDDVGCVKWPTEGSDMERTDGTMNASPVLSSTQVFTVQKNLPNDWSPELFNEKSSFSKDNDPIQRRLF